MKQKKINAMDLVLSKYLITVYYKQICVGQYICYVLLFFGSNNKITNQLIYDAEVVKYRYYKKLSR